jgi:hypothetical protein
MQMPVSKAGETDPGHVSRLGNVLIRLSCIDERSLSAPDSMCPSRIRAGLHHERVGFHFNLRFSAEIFPFRLIGLNFSFVRLRRFRRILRSKDS